MIEISSNETTGLSVDVIQASELFVNTARGLEDKTLWTLLMFVASNMFLQHLDIFYDKKDPIPQFTDV